MKLMKQITILIFTTLFGLAAFADQASNDAKLALLVADESRLESVDVSAFDPALKAEKSLDGDESSAVVVTLKLNGQIRKYVISRDGGGQIVSVTLVQ